MSQQRPLTPAELLAMPDAALKRIIEEEVRGDQRGHPEGTSAALRAPEMLDRVYFMLIRIQRNTEGQLAAWSRDLDVAKGELLGTGKNDASYLQRRGAIAKRQAAAVRFKTGLEVFLQEIKYLRQANRPDDDSSLTSECARLGARVDELEAAIRRHRDAFPPMDDPTDEDLALWQLATPGSMPGDATS